MARAGIRFSGFYLISDILPVAKYLKWGKTWSLQIKSWSISLHLVQFHVILIFRSLKGLSINIYQWSLYGKFPGLVNKTDEASSVCWWCQQRCVRSGLAFCHPARQNIAQLWPRLEVKWNWRCTWYIMLDHDKESRVYKYWAVNTLRVESQPKRDITQFFLQNSLKDML